MRTLLTRPHPAFLLREILTMARHLLPAVLLPPAQISLLRLIVLTAFVVLGVRPQFSARPTQSVLPTGLLSTGLPHLPLRANPHPLCLRGPIRWIDVLSIPSSLRPARVLPPGVLQAPAQWLRGQTPRDQLLHAQLLHDPTFGLRQAIPMRLVRHQTTDGCPLAAPPTQGMTGRCSGHRRLTLRLCQVTLSCRAVLSRRAILRRLVNHQATDLCALIAPSIRGIGESSRRRRPTRRPGVIRGFRSLEVSLRPKSRPSLGTQACQLRQLPLLAVLRRRDLHLLALGASLAHSILERPVDSRYLRPVDTQLR